MYNQYEGLLKKEMLNAGATFGRSLASANRALNSRSALGLGNISPAFWSKEYKAYSYPREVKEIEIKLSDISL